MFSNKRFFTIVTVITLMALLPTAALAAAFSVDGWTITYPSSYASCNPVDNIVFDKGDTTNYIKYRFLRWDYTTNRGIELGNGILYDDAVVPFPYGSVTGTLTFVVDVEVFNTSGALVTKGGQQWKITCEPPPGGEGCTPGYWRNHFEDWPPTGYSPADIFDTVFGTAYFTPTYTLGQAINQGGGGLNRLARHGTAALLSAAHPDVDYPYTVAEVIFMVQAGMIDPLAAANELGCHIP